MEGKIKKTVIILEDGSAQNEVLFHLLNARYVWNSCFLCNIIKYLLR